MVTTAEPVLQQPQRQIKFKTSMRGVDVIQTVYALLVALGLRDVFAAFYNIFEQASVNLRGSFLVALALFVNIILLSVRFFWVPRNFRRLYFEATFATGFAHPGLKPWEVSLNIFVILLHGALHFLLCKQFEYFVFISMSYQFLVSSSFATYVFLHVSMLVVNGLWILYTTRREDSLRLPDGPDMFKPKPASRLWYRSNLAFALIAVAPLVVFSSCSASLSQCLQAAYPEPQLLSLLPMSALSVASFFDLVSPLFSELAGSHDGAIAAWAMMALLINSLVDLLFTSSYYVLLEDYEDELAYKTGP
jgi:hypothetical protein